MKKILLPILALGGLLFASSCQMDEPDAGTLTGEVDFTITAGIPGSITTYADGEPETAFSHLGGANNVAPNLYDLRYILKVYDDETLAYEEIQTVKSDFAGEKVNFSARLLAKKYTFVLWADFVKEGTTSDLYYDTDDLTMVSYTSTVTDDFNMRAKYLSSDAIDAYTAYQEINLSESSQNVNISLKRPFGKIRLLATDAPDNNDANTQIPNKVSIKFAEDTWVPSTYNAKIGQVSEGNNILIDQYSFDAIREVQPQVTGHDELAEEDNSAYLLGQTYIFASASIPSYNMTVTAYNNGTQIGYRELTNIPVSANKLTTVIGNFYTNEGSIDVIVEDEFGNGEDVKELEDLTYPDNGVLLIIGETQTHYNTIADAIAAIGKDENATITLANKTYEEAINPGTTQAGQIRIVGQSETKVKAANLLSGDYVIENIEFYGGAGYTGSSVYVGNISSLELRNCNISIAEQLSGQARPLETITGFAGTLIVDGCTVSANEKATYSYLNPAAEGGKIQILNATFNDPLVAEYYSTGVYPELSGNTFKGTVEFTASDAEKAAGSLSYATKLWVNGILSNNTFEGTDKVVAYLSGEPTNYNDPIAVGGIINETTGYDYNNISDALKNIEGTDNNILILSSGVYEENLTIPAGKTVTLKGSADHGTTLKGQITTTGANVAVEGIVIENTAYGIYSDGGSSITATDCIFNVTPNESNNNTAVMTWASNGTHESVVLTNCTFNAEGVRTVQLRQVKSAVIEGCTFNDPYSYAVQLDEAWTNLTFKNNTVNNAMSAIYIHQGTTGSSVSQENNTLNNVQFPYAARPQALNEQSNSLEGFWYYVTSRADDENNMAKALASASTGDYICVTAGEYVLGQIQDKSVNFVGPNVGIPGTSNERKEEAILKVKVYQPKTRPNVKISFDGVKIIQSQSNTILFDVEGGADVTVKNSIVEVDSPASKGLLYANGTRIPANITFENNLLKCTGDENVSLWVYGNKSTSPSNVNVKILNNTLEGIYLNFGLGGNDATKSAMEISGNVFRNLDEGVAAVCLNASSVDNGGFIVKGNDFSAVTTACAYYSSYAEARCDQEDNINWITMNKY